MYTSLLSAYLAMLAMFTRDGRNINDWVMQLKKDAYELLDKIYKGEMILVDSSGNQIARLSGQNYSNNEDYYTIFDVDDIENQQLDSERSEDIADDRDS